MKTTYVKSIETEQTGGGVMLDYVTLKNGYVIVIGEDMVCVYRSMDDFEAGDFAESTVYVKL